MGTHVMAASPINPRPWVLQKSQNCYGVGFLVTLENHLAEVFRSKPRRPVYRRKRHVSCFLGLFGPIRAPYLKGLNC